MKTTKSEAVLGKILCSLNNEAQKDSYTIEQRLIILEKLLQFIIDNELRHIWLFIKIILGGIIAIFGGLAINLLVK